MWRANVRQNSFLTFMKMNLSPSLIFSWELGLLGHAPSPPFLLLVYSRDAPGKGPMGSHLSSTSESRAGIFRAEIIRGVWGRRTLYSPCTCHLGRHLGAILPCLYRHHQQEWATLVLPLLSHGTTTMWGLSPLHLSPGLRQTPPTSWLSKLQV